jgi:hypothetical protein
MASIFYTGTKKRIFVETQITRIDTDLRRGKTVFYQKQKPVKTGSF